SGSCQGGWGIGISATSPHPKEAWEVIQFMVSEDVERDFILRTGKVPSLNSLFTDPQIVAKYPHYPELFEISKQATLRPPIAQYAQVSDILQRYLSAAFTETMTPTEAMEAAAKETRALLGKN
ncbi:MAG: ABC transporter substrate-binding protein, partial [Microcystaceae cyanobacterium]